jgi:hypothetical protein
MGCFILDFGSALFDSRCRLLKNPKVSRSFDLSTLCGGKGLRENTMNQYLALVAGC